MGRRNKKSVNTCDSDEVKNVRITCEFLERDAKEYDECEENDDRCWREKFLQLRKPKSNRRIMPQKLKKR